MATDSNSDDDVPPLEDMSELMEQLNTLHDMKQTLPNAAGHTDSRPAPTREQAAPKTHGHSTSVQAVSENSKAITQKPPSNLSNFAGFKKGFLFGPKPSSSSKKVADKTYCSKQDTIPLIRPKHPVGSQKIHEIPEVQEAMKPNIPLLNNQEWITADFVKKIEENPTLAKYLMDPRFSKALSKMQSDPKAAWDMLQGNAELQKVLSDFCGLMGDHLTKFGEQDSSKDHKNSADGIGMVEQSTTQSRTLPNTSPSSLPLSQQPSKEDDAAMNKILANPEIMKVLQDSEIQKLISSLKLNPDAAQLQMRSASPEVREKIRKLVDAGLLAFT